MCLSVFCFVFSLGRSQELYLCVAVVGVPAGSEVLLPADVPNQEVRVTDGDLLHVAADGWRRVDGLLSQAVLCGKLATFKNTTTGRFIWFIL